MSRAPLRRLAAAGLTLALAVGTVAVTDVGATSSDPVAVTGPMEPINNWFAGQRDTGDLTRAQAQSLARRQALGLRKTSMATNPDLASAEWFMEGPRNIGGRVTDIAVDVAQPNTIYVAAASGGVWLSEDAGLTHTSIWPDTFPPAIGAIQMGSDGTLWVGTGESNPGGGSIVFGGEGVFRSTDRGATWDHVGLAGTAAIGRIAVDPTNPSRVLVAASGDLYVPGGERGLYETLDGGETWHLILAGANDTTGAIDISLDPTNPDRAFVSMWDHQREPDLRRYGGPGSGLFETNDGGVTWFKVEGGGYPDGDLGRIGVAIAPSAPNVVYSIVITPDGPLQGFYRSLDRGQTWTEVQEGPNALGLLGFSQSSYGWWFGRIFVDPIDPLFIYVAGLVLVTSQDGGTTLSYVPNVHADQHIVAYDPLLPDRLYLGNDGGVSRHDARGVGPGWVYSIDEPWTQSYSVNISQQDPNRLVTGLQDNGINRNYGGIRNPIELPLGAGVNIPVPDGVVPEDGGFPEVTHGQSWNEYAGGDGLAARIDPKNDSIVYGCSQYGNCSRSDDGGDTSGAISKPGGSRFGWYSPLELDPTDPSVIYQGSEYVSRSTDRGETWKNISDDLGYGIHDDYELPVGRDAAYNFGTITTIEPASDGQTIWAGTDNGLLWVTRDLGEDGWFDLYDKALPDTWITRIAEDPAVPGTAYVTFSTFRSGGSEALIVKVEDFGAKITDVSGNLPDAPLHDILVLGDRLVVASDVGVFASDNDGRTWSVVGGNLPMGPVMELAYNHDVGTLAAGTFGRGVWTVVLP